MIMLFNLVTLPVEFDASRRAKACWLIWLHRARRRSAGVKKVLDAAAWTYVAAFITSLAYFLWHLLPLLLGGNRRGINETKQPSNQTKHDDEHETQRATPEHPRLDPPDSWVEKQIFALGRKRGSTRRTSGWRDWRTRVPRIR